MTSDPVPPTASLFRNQVHGLTIPPSCRSWSSATISTMLLGLAPSAHLTQQVSCAASSARSAAAAGSCALRRLPLAPAPILGPAIAGSGAPRADTFLVKRGFVSCLETRSVVKMCVTRPRSLRKWRKSWCHMIPQSGRREPAAAGFKQNILSSPAVYKRFRCDLLYLTIIMLT